MEEMTKLFEGFIGSCKSLTEEMERMLHEIEEQKMFINNQNEHIQEIESTVVELKEEIKEHKTFISNQNEQIEKQKAFIMNQNEQIEEQKTFINNQNEHIQGLECQMKEQQGCIERLEAEMVAIKKSIILSQENRNTDGRPSVSDADVETIRRLRTEGITIRQIAERCGVSVGVVSKYTKDISKPSKKPAAQ